MKRLSLEWRDLDAEQTALVFDKETWKAYETTAELRGINAEEMITRAVVGLLGQVLYDRRRDGETGGTA
jgi:hypothetical protein